MLRAILSLILLTCLSRWSPTHAQPLPVPEVNQTQQSFTRQQPITFSGKYLLHLPEGYATTPEKRWPLILFLHGVSSRGDNLAAVEREGIPFWLKAGQKLPFIVVSPQCPADEYWDSRWMIENLNALLNEIASAHRVDAARVYLTGWSLGGAGAWRLASMYPQRFAAVVPLCGRTQLRYVAGLKTVPVRAYHGADDKTVPLNESIKTVEALKRAGGSVELTVIDKAGHDIWETVYADPGLYEWFLRHERR